MGPCVLLTDEHDTPLRPAVLYGVDTRSVRRIRRIEQRLGAEEIIRRGGSALTTQAAGPKIAWIAEEEPERYARAPHQPVPVGHGRRAAGTRNLAGGMATSGAIANWLRDLFAAGDQAELTRLAAESGPGANGLLLLPYFSGELIPVMDPDGRGVIAGLTLSHTRGDLYRAALEAIGFGVRHNIEVIEAAGGDIRRVVAVGGGTQGALWTQVVSDITGRPQELRTTTIGAGYGGALLAAQLAGDASIDEWNPVRETVTPRAEHAGRYDELYGLYRRLYPDTADVVHALAAVQER